MTDFIIIGNTNAITYKEVFPLIKNNKVRLGYNHIKMFCTGGIGLQKFGNIGWFSTYPVHKPTLTLTKTYDPDKYPKYDNYPDAINVDRVKDIPYDYDGVMGVPITFLDKYCPTQFEIVKFRKGDDDKDLAVNGKTPYFRILIRRKIS